jgi:hypothetical protein
MGDELEIQNEELAALVTSSRRIDANTWQVTLVDGTTMTVDNDGNRVSVDTNAPWYLPVPDQRMVSDNVGLSSPAAAPASVRNRGDAGETSQWSLGSLEDAQRWLRAHADYLGRLYWGMKDIADLVNGPASAGYPALGGFETALTLKAKHDALSETFRTAIKGLIENLHDTADALGKIATNYARVEERNALTAAQWAAIFGEQGDSTHDVKPA